MKKQLFTLLFVLSTLWAMAQPPIVLIDTVQYMSPARLGQLIFNQSGKDSTLPDYLRPIPHNARYGDTVTVEGIVTFEPTTYALSTSRSRRSAFLQAADNRSWCGIEVMLDTTVFSSGSRPSQAQMEAASQFTQNMKLGRKVRVTGIVGHFQNNSQLYILPVPTQVISLGNTINPQTVQIADLMKNNQGSQEPQFATAEQWEGVYVELKNVSVASVSVSGQRWFWSVKDVNGNEINIRDYSGYYRNDNNDDDVNTPRSFTPPAIGSKLAYIRGVITEGGNGGSKQYYIAPLYPTDVALPSAEPPTITNIRRNPIIVDGITAPVITATITDDTAVASATLYYAVGYNNNNFTAVQMTANGNVYGKFIPVQTPGTIVKYFIRAVDNSGNVIDAPDSLASTSAYKVLNGINSIKEIQETPYSHGGSMYVNDTLRSILVKGVVVSTNAANDLGLFAIQTGSSPWSSIFVRPTLGDGVTEWKRGDSVIITEAIVRERYNLGSDPFGSVSNSFGVTFLENVKFILAGRCRKMPEVTHIPLDSLLSPTFSKEPYEAMLLSYTDAYVISQNPDAPSNFGEFTVHTNQNAPAGFRGENYSNDLGFTFNTDSLTVGEKLPVFKGILSYAHGNWKIYPRNRTDVSKRGDLIPPYIVRDGADTVYHVKGTKYDDIGATACDDMDGDITSDLVIDEPAVNINVAGTYIVTFDVKDAAGNPAPQLKRVVIVQNGQSIDELGKNLSIGLYPVPASTTLNLAIVGNYEDEAQVNIVDITGKTIYSQNISFTAGQNTISLPANQLSNGIYFCQFSSKYFNTTQKFVVVK